jgi:magnesium transporter
MRRALSRFHRLVLPLREALNSLVRHQHALVRPEVLPYWQDLYDHIVVVSETTDGLRDIVNSLVDANLALRDYRQNEVVKTVSSWAAIVAVPALVTGYYGMNVPFPGSGETSGVILSAVIIVGLSVGLYALFRRNGWL